MFILILLSLQYVIGGTLGARLGPCTRCGQTTEETTEGGPAFWECPLIRAILYIKLNHQDWHNE